MRSFAVCLLLWTAPVFGQEKADTAYLELFDGATDFGWRGDSVRKVVDGKLEIKGAGDKPGQARHGGRFQEFHLTFDFHEVADNPGAALTLVRAGKDDVSIKLPQTGERGADPWLKAHIQVQKDLFSYAFLPSARVDQKPKFSDNPSVLTGSILQWSVPAGSTLYLRNVRLKPLGLKAIYNGRDLTGWKEFPGKKSTFAVTEKGEINIKDGPGDLQTEGKYGDFLLQLECISNGKHLNSGVFFRCRPGEYQNGYEAQIRNQFTPEPTQDYVIEEYDPATNKLIEKKKVKYTAVDFGTGAIYRRQPARKEVARDGEWFTMTILAHQNHFMTWVNGVQVTDWTDNRPKSDNARTGCRLEPGHISLQGHDPTTDLSFRAFRIGDIK